MSYESPRLMKISKSYTDFSTAAFTNTITLFTLPPMVFIRRVFAKHNAPFTGGTIIAYNITVGTSTSNSKYLSTTNVFGSASPTTFNANTLTNGGLENFTATTGVTATATSVTGLLNAATSGSIDFYIELGSLI